MIKRVKPNVLDAVIGKKKGYYERTNYVNVMLDLSDREWTEKIFIIDCLGQIIRNENNGRSYFELSDASILVSDFEFNEESGEYKAVIFKPRSVFWELKKDSYWKNKQELQEAIKNVRYFTHLLQFSYSNVTRGTGEIKKLFRTIPATYSSADVVVKKSKDFIDFCSKLIWFRYYYLPGINLDFDIDYDGFYAIEYSKFPPEPTSIYSRTRSINYRKYGESFKNYNFESGDLDFEMDYVRIPVKNVKIELHYEEIDEK